MQSRQFRAKTMSEALRETRKALGADAMIVSARTMEGPSGYVEVTAVGSSDSGSNPSKRAKLGKSNRAKKELTDDIVQNVYQEDQFQKTIAPIKDDINSLRKTVNDLARITSQSVLPGFSDLRTLIMEASQEQEASRMLGPIYTELLELGVLPDIARDLVRTAEMKIGLQDVDPKNWLSLARGMVKELIAARMKLGGPLVADDNSRIFVFVGPSGVGKTTTIAKIASRLALSEGLDVVMLTTDTYRVGSVDQSRRYAELIGIPLVVAERPEMMGAALRSYANADVLLIDTPGRAFENEGVRQSITDVLNATGENYETHLLVSATFSSHQQERVVHNFEDMHPSRLIMTKVDESAQLGCLLNIQSVCDLPYSYLTRGHRVPEDIEVAGARRMAQMIFKNVTE